MKKVVFIGNRFGVLSEILKESSLQVKHIFCVKNSYLENKLMNTSISYQTFNNKIQDQIAIINQLKGMDFDILISNGCPFILPISKIKKQNQLFINVHPSYLPYLRGLHPINFVILNKLKYFGATTHFMSDGIDSGNIIYREKINFSSDIDLDLLYHLTFDLEIKVFQIAIKKLIQSNYQYKGQKQKNASILVSRSNYQHLDFQLMFTKQILLTIRAFGTISQGIKVVLESKKYIIYKAENIKNKYLLNKNKKQTPGKIIFKYGENMLIKTKDGIIKITKYLPL